MGEVINWGIIGLGNVAHEFAKSFYNTKNEKNNQTYTPLFELFYSYPAFTLDSLRNLLCIQ